MTHDPLPPLTPEEGGLHGEIPDTPEMRAWFQGLGERTNAVTHDPLCRYKEAWVLNSKGYWYCIECAFIAEVRKDERKKSTTSNGSVHVCADNNCWCANSLRRSELS